MIASPVRTTIAFRAVLIAVTTGTSTWGFASRGSEPGRIPTVRPPPRFAPLHAASITPFSPPHTTTASARAMRNPTSSASWIASGDAVFDPPITAIIGFRSSMVSFSKSIPPLKLFDRRYQPRFSPENLCSASRPHPWARRVGLGGGTRSPPRPWRKRRINEELSPLSLHLKVCEDRLRADPDDVDALFTRGVLLAKILEHRRALRCIDRVAEIDAVYRASRGRRRSSTRTSAGCTPRRTPAGGARTRPRRAA